MYKVLLADDEEIIRDGLSKTFDWESHGFKVVGTAGNGKTAFELIKTLKPNLVITDIRMPLINGVELLKKIKINFPEIIVLLLSGFTDFEYVREGLNSGASGYIQKSKIEEELQQMLPKIHKNINEKNFQSHFNDIPEESVHISSRIASILTYIDEHSQERVLIQDIAEKFSINASYLSTVFKKEMNMTFSEYLIKMKMNKAALLIQNGGNVEGSAYEVGYSDLKHFRKMFKKYFGFNPGSLMK